MAANTSAPKSISSYAAQEEHMLQQQREMNLQQEKFQMESAMQQAHHDTMTAIIKAIAS